MTNRKDYRVLLTTGIFVLLLTGIRILWYQFQAVPDQPAAVQGVLDLRHANITDERVFKLDGQWEFYPNQLIMQPEGGAIAVHGQPESIQVPGNWGAVLSPGTHMQYGYGSYRLRVLTKPDDGKLYSIHIPEVIGASELYVNGRLLGHSGHPAANEEEYRSRNIPYGASFAAGGDEIEIVIQAANFDNGIRGGIFKSVKFGSVPSIAGMNWWSIGGQLAVCIILLMHAIYACSVYGMGVRKKELLLFFALATSMIGAVLLDDDRLLLTWLPLNYGWGVKLMHLFYIGVSVFLCQFAKQFLIRYMAPGTYRTFTLICILYAAVILVTPVKYMFYIKILVVFIFLYAVVTVPVLMFRSALRSGEDGLFLMLGSIGIMLNSVWGAIKNLFWPDAGFYPIDLTIAFIAFAFYWFKSYYITSSRTEELTVELQAANKQKDSFLANTSHELRNPLHGILNIAQSVLDSGKNLQDEKNRESLALLISVGKRMSYMLNDLLDLTRLQEKRLRLNLLQVRIKAVASYVIEMLQFMTEGKSIRLVNAIPDTFPAVMADENRLAQIMFNLLHNAVKYTLSGSVSIHAAAVDGVAFIRITDTGIGIDEETRQRIFQPYEQGDPEMLGGLGELGLGLSICEQLVELHGGTLEVASVPGQSSVFTFTLRLSDTALSPAAAIGGEAAPAVRYNEAAVSRESAAAASAWETAGIVHGGTERRRILMVDDDAVNLKILVNMLSAQQYDIATATSGMEAVALLDTAEWDLIVTDVMMPHMSGLELSRLIRERYSLSELPILLLTARSQTEDVYAGFLAGANDYVMKPVDALELKARVNALTDLTQSIRERLRMEGAWLQAQIKPHFLFNTLNAIAALSEADTERMRSLIEVFGHYLRASFDFQNSEQLVPLEHELELVRSYLFIEKERFEDRLRIVWEVDDNLRLQIPPLSIQPLVENAVRHGILKRSRGGEVKIRITSYGDYAEIAIEDDGVGMDEDTRERLLDRRSGQPQGIGLLNTDRRLKQVYGNGLKVRSIPNQGTTVAFHVTK
ncbi:response regulator [Paenibacillus piri]|uniref:histidine kinase n=2 Tax=Paenibacillus piri TaxID=2547395 RepID=A0A4R5L0C6_9BACL|nr:response regulator [Paenibacillus piri]